MTEEVGVKLSMGLFNTKVNPCISTVLCCACTGSTMFYRSCRVYMPIVGKFTFGGEKDGK